MDTNVQGTAYRVFLASLSRDGADAKVIDPQKREHWVSFGVNEVKGLFDPDGELYPAAEDLVAKWAAEEIHAQVDQK